MSPVLPAAAVTVLPAMASMWWFLKRYEGYFQDAKVFFSLIVGFFVGLAAAALEFLVFRFGDGDFRAAAGVGTAFLFFVIGYAFFETGAKAMVLGMRRFRQQRDTPYYGAALGLGMGAMAAMMVVANAARVAEERGTPYSWSSYAAMAAVPVGAVFVHGAAGAWVGKGSADGKLWKGWGIGTLLQIPVLAALWLLWPSLGQGNVIVLFPALFTPVYGIALLWMTQKHVLDAVVPKEIQDRLARERRREARRKEKEGTAVRRDEEE